ncbi:hypothetical protein DXT99_01795 [Pontibacter diazotrophicus]|uniref:Uncharacterized protein n=1 Tax=Pontibacter diazotrophicus TaxID=1400979 RepID=A0A3D8LHG4_9BACT|nr:hypothetical protein [Pontibacter diazotrophicus]RDV16871.1 hypothetical protein DXT99_01795 [Pontibacter diazotrophicus]
MNKITATIAYTKLREFLSEMTNWSVDIITGNLKLSRFNIDALGMVKFTNSLNEVYKDYRLHLSDEKVSECKIVNDLFILIWKSIPSELRDEPSLSNAINTIKDSAELASSENIDQSLVFYKMLIDEIDASNRIYKKTEGADKVVEKDLRGGNIYININL